jgi:hypothetical protein
MTPGGSMPETKSELQLRIRFALAQLGPLNKHHEFEHLARQFARLRVASNVMPATGPVAGWGDQGRDFENFRSYITNSPIADSTFVALVSGKKIVGACSLQKDIEPKIREDIKTIVDSSEKIDEIYNFCEVDLPVGKRHALQTWADSSYHVKLDIFDGQTLSEQLTDHDVWWIAQQYLSIPADVFPRDLAEGERYTALRKRWLEEAREPLTFADFVEIDAGLRQAMYEKGCRADLLPWLGKIRQLLHGDCPEGMRRKVQYEIAVVALRGLDNLSAEAELVAQFFGGLHAGLSPAELQDATVLLTYCVTATGQGHFNVDPAKLVEWTSNLVSLLDQAISHAPGNNSLCDLLLSRAQICVIPLRSTKYTAKPEQMLKYWGRMLDVLPEAPLFPLEHFADMLTKLTPFLVQDPKYPWITERIDQLLEQRSSGFVAAQKCLDRAKSLFQDSHFVKALQQLQRAKVKWFTAETLPKALVAMLLAAECYEHLKLFYAAKYYSAGVVFILHRETDQRLKKFLPRAAFHLCGACYASGACLSYMEVLHLALLMHESYMPDPFDLEKHQALSEQLSQVAILRSVTGRLAADLLPTLDRMGGEWNLADDLWSLVTEISRPGTEPWDSLPSEEMWRRIQGEIGGPIFSDVGARRTIRWTALGITWTLSFANTYELALLGEELAATLQIIQADLADVDLCLFPTTADIELELTDESRVVLEEVPDNNVARWLLRIPSRWLPPHHSNSDEELNPLTLAAIILGQCSALTFDKFTAILESAFKTGLATKAFTVRPARELFASIHSKDVFQASKRAELNPPKPPEWFKIAPASELAWREAPGPGYSLKKAEGFIRNRYENAIRPIRLTLPRLTDDTRICLMLRDLQEKGLPDWQILNIIANIVTNFRVRNEIGSSTDFELMNETFAKWMFHDETPADPAFPNDLFTEEELKFIKNATLTGYLQTWGLISNLRTPDFTAIRRFLDVRYRNSTDDVPHTSYFPDWS